MDISFRVLIVSTLFFGSVGCASKQTPYLQKTASPNPMINSNVITNRKNDRFNPLVKRPEDAKPVTNAYGFPIQGED